MSLQISDKAKGEAVIKQLLLFLSYCFV